VDDIFALLLIQKTDWMRLLGVWYIPGVARHILVSVRAMMEKRRLTWMESISTDKTRAPSFARRAASGRPTTSDLPERNGEFDPFQSD